MGLVAGIANEWCLSSADDGISPDTFAEVLVGGVVGEPSELFLYGFGELRIKYDRVSRSLARELLVKVGYIKHRFLKKRRFSSDNEDYPRNDVQLKA